MCSVLDDVIGWCAFTVTGECRPWSGFTVQVNTNLCKPIPINTTLLVQATVTNFERRKVSIEAILFDPSMIGPAGESEPLVNIDNQQHLRVIHATGSGMVILNRGVLPELLVRDSILGYEGSMPLT
jgi:hypothetical protein